MPTGHATTRRPTGSRRTRAIVIALIAVLALVAASCSDDGDEGVTGPTATPTSEEPTAEPPADEGEAPDEAEPPAADEDPAGSGEAVEQGSAPVESGGGAPSRPIQLDEITFASSLSAVDSCPAFLDRVKAEAAARVGPYGLEQGGGFPRPMPLAVEEEAMEDLDAPAAEGAPTDDSASSAPVVGGEPGTDFSTTNVQVAGVDEPDIVKTDGDRIVAIANSSLHVVDISGTEPVLTGSVPLEGFGQELFLAGDRAVVISSGGVDVLPVEPGPAADALIAPVAVTTRVLEVDLSDPSAPRVANTLELDGTYVSARAVDGTARLVVSSYPEQLGFVFPSSPASESLAEETNRRVVEESTLEQWLPSYRTSGDAGELSGLLAPCEAVWFPAEFAGFDLLSVVTLDLDAPLAGPGPVASVLAGGDTVYASDASVYVATNVWVPPEVVGTEPAEFAEEYSTAIHRFDTSDPGAVGYVASGSVRGHLLDQFSMNEHQGDLQVATTDGTPWGFAEDSESFVTVLRSEGDQLVQVGQVGELGRGQRITAVRFYGDFASVVTFRFTDPLYTVDLRDPTAPAVTGQLEIPGFSSYLHPIGDGLVLGVGQEATEDGFTTGAKVSLFDVADPANPTQLDTWVLEGATSDVEFDHRAFLWWAPERIAVVPMQSYATGFSGAIVLRVDDATLTEAGRITHDDGGPVPEPDCRPLEVETPELGPDTFVQICGPDDVGGAPGFVCEPAPATDAAGILGVPADEIGEVGDDERVELCFPDFGGLADPIQRALVASGDLWTLTWTELQANDLTTFEPKAVVNLG